MGLFFSLTSAFQMYVSAHGRVAASVLEMLGFYKPGFVLVLLFKEILGKGGKLLNFLSNFHPKWLGKGTLLHP